MSITQRLSGIVKIPPEYLKENPPAPKSVKIELTSVCNYKCSYCPVNFRDKQPKQNMDWDLFQKISNELKVIGVKEIGLFLIGEPFVNTKLLVRAIDYLKQELQFPYVFITSNASLASPGRVKDCMKAGLDSLKWSCNAADNCQFTQMMNMPVGLFHLAKENIKSAWEIRNSNNYKTKIYASSIRYDNNQPERMKTMLVKDILPFVDEHYWLPLYSMGGVATQKEKEMGLRPIAGNTGRYDDPVDPIPCWTLFTAGHILSDGRMTACCADGTGYWQVGDLNTQSFMEAWHSDDFTALRRAHISLYIAGTKCERCALHGV